MSPDAQEFPPCASTLLFIKQITGNAEEGTRMSCAFMGANHMGCAAVAYVLSGKIDIEGKCIESEGISNFT